MTSEELQRLRELLERGRKTTPRLSAFRRAMRLIKGKMASRPKPPAPDPETDEKDAA